MTSVQFSHICEAPCHQRVLSGHFTWCWNAPDLTPKVAVKRQKPRVDPDSQIKSRRPNGRSKKSHNTSRMDSILVLCPTFTVAVNLIGSQWPWYHPVLKLFILDLWPVRETPVDGREEKRRRDQITGTLSTVLFFLVM